MRYAIVAYYNGNMYRLCDLETGETQDLDGREIISLIEDGYHIENVDIRNKNITEYTKYTKIKHDGTSDENTKVRYYLVESSNNYHLLCNHLGEFIELDNEEVLKISDQIMNPVDLEMNLMVKKYDKYTGEFISAGYNNVLSCYNLNEYANYCILDRVNYKYVGKKLVNENKKTSLSLDVTKLKTNKNGIVTYGDTIITGNAFTKVNSNQLLARLVSNSYVRKIIDDALSDMESKRGKSARKDKETGIVLSTTKFRYSPIRIYTNDLSKGSMTQDMDLIAKYMKIYFAMNTEMWIDIKNKDGYFLLNRIINNNGISYKYIKANGVYDYTSTIPIEQLFEQKVNFINLSYDGNDLTVYGLDGTYKYDMEKVYDEYNSRLVKTNKAVKARVLGLDYSEDITAGGVLLKLKTDSDKLIIPSRVKVVGKKSIELHENNTEIVFEDGVERVYATCFVQKHYNQKIKSVSINFKSIKAGVELIRAISKNWAMHNGVELTYNRDISIAEVREIASQGMEKTIVNAPNMNLNNKIKDEDAFEIFKQVALCIGVNIPLLGKRSEYKKSSSGYTRYIDRDLETHYQTLQDIYYEINKLVSLHNNLLRPYFSFDINMKIHEYLINLKEKTVYEIKNA